MNRRGMQDVVSCVDRNWPKDYIIRYLYVKLAPFFQRDLNYFLASDEEKLLQYKAGFINRFPGIVCSTLADYYVELFSAFNINAKKIIANSAKIPLFAIVVEGDYGWYFIDPINDLFPNQYNLDTSEFGSLPHYNTLRRNYPDLIKLDRKYIEQIDTGLGLPKTNTEFFKGLHLEMAHRNSALKHFKLDKSDHSALFIAKMDYADEFLINLGHVNGLFERAQLYLFLEKILFFKTEKKNITIKINPDIDVPFISIQYTNPYTGSSILYEEHKEEDTFKLHKILK